MSHLRAYQMGTQLPAVSQDSAQGAKIGRDRHQLDPEVKP